MSGILVALQVGTLTIDTVGNGSKPDLYSLRINRSGNFGGGVEYWLTSSKEINWQTKFGAQLIAKVKFGSTTIVKFINWSNGLDPLMGESEFSPTNNYPITVEFYVGIRNITNAAQTQGAVFQFEDGSGPNLGSFKIQYRNNLNTDNYKDIPFATGDNPLPFFTTNYNNGSEGFLNEVVDQRKFFTLTIERIPSETTINLIDASGISKARIGQARLTLTGYNSPSTQGVSIAFADGNGSTDTNFRLKHKDAALYIPFSLYLEGEKVDRGVPIPWPNLSYGNGNLKALKVGGITTLDATSAVGGEYSDTITVTITALDSNLYSQ
ncbi:MAG TPA: hypothetical protein VJ869_02780 [Sphaerochaeta sp.]|nr:hypothetical protein [Sphaerochaeta sp.]